MNLIINSKDNLRNYNLIENDNHKKEEIECDLKNTERK